MTRSLEVKGQRPETDSRIAGICVLRHKVIETTKSLEVKGQRPETVNGAGKAPIPIKRRGGMPVAHTK
jgi:hypothetical protein